MLRPQSMTTCRGYQPTREKCLLSWPLQALERKANARSSLHTKSMISLLTITHSLSKSHLHFHSLFFLTKLAWHFSVYLVFPSDFLSYCVLTGCYPGFPHFGCVLTRAHSHHLPLMTAIYAYMLSTKAVLCWLISEWILEEQMACNQKLCRPIKCL